MKFDFYFTYWTLYLGLCAYWIVHSKKGHEFLERNFRGEKNFDFMFTEVSWSRFFLIFCFCVYNVWHSILFHYLTLNKLFFPHDSFSLQNESSIIRNIKEINAGSIKTCITYDNKLVTFEMINFVRNLVISQLPFSLMTHAPFKTNPIPSTFITYHSSHWIKPFFSNKCRDTVSFILYTFLWSGIGKKREYNQVSDLCPFQNKAFNWWMRVNNFTFLTR